MEMIMLEKIGTVVGWIALLYFLCIFVWLLGAWLVESRIIQRSVQRVIDGTRAQIREVGLPTFLLLCAFTVAMTISAQKRAGDGGDDNVVNDLVGRVSPRPPQGEGSGGLGETTLPRGGVSGPPRVVFQSPLAFSGGAPVNFTNPPGILVQTIMLATKADAADLATLMDVTDPYSMEFARLRFAAAGGGAAPEMSATEQSLADQFDPGQWRVVALDLPGPVPLDALHFGNSAGRAAWQREWRGGIKEVVCFSAPPNEDIRAGTANYLAVRWRFAGWPYTATPAQRQTAIDAGLNYGVVWATVIIVR